MGNPLEHHDVQVGEHDPKAKQQLADAQRVLRTAQIVAEGRHIEPFPFASAMLQAASRLVGWHFRAEPTEDRLLTAIDELCGIFRRCALLYRREFRGELAPPPDRAQ